MNREPTDLDLLAFVRSALSAIDVRTHADFGADHPDIEVLSKSANEFHCIRLNIEMVRSLCKLAGGTGLHELAKLLRDELLSLHGGAA